MSHTQSPGMFSASHYRGTASAVIGGIRLALRAPRHTSIEIPKGALRSIQDLFACALSGIERERTGTPRKDRTTTESLCAHAIAQDAAVNTGIDLKPAHTLEKFLKRADTLLDRLQTPDELDSDDRADIELVVQFLQHIVTKGEIDAYDRLMSPDLDD